MKRYLAVFCGSSTGSNPIYSEKARALGQLMVAHNFHLVYGAGNVGLMGVIADEVLKHGGEAIGVIPQHLVDMEVAHSGLTELIVTDTMHQRKSIMAERADGFVAMPGGIGTLEEIAEIMTWSQLDLHHKPVAFLNVNNYYDQLYAFLRHSIDEQFVKTANVDEIIFESDPEVLLQQVNAYEKTYTPKWLK